MNGDQDKFEAEVVALISTDADLYEQRNAVYENNHELVGRIMADLFGEVRLVTEQDYEEHHLLELVIVKLTRFAAARRRREVHVDSMRDMRVYLAMLEVLYGKRNSGAISSDDASIRRVLKDQPQA